MERLKQSVNPTDILERYTAVVESVTESPLTKGNKVTLLIDGPATYAAMFEAIRNAKDHINLETFIIEDDEIGGKFTDLLLKKQAEGVQVNIIYDSVGSITTPESFFKRLRDGGIQVVEFNPKNPFKAPGSWFLVRQDHRKILIADGKVAIIGGINISNVYSSSLSRRKKVKGVPLTWRDTDIQIEGPAVTEVQKLFLETWQKQKGPTLAGHNYLPDHERKRESPGEYRWQYTRHGQPNYVYRVCGRDHLCGAFHSSDECLFYPGRPDIRCLQGCCQARC